MSLVIALVFVALSLFLTFLLSSVRRPENFPPGPQWWPWIGNSYQLKRLSKLLGGQHLALEELSKQFNSPIVGLKLGSEYFVSVCTYPFVKEVLAREEFEGRPDSFFFRLRTMGTRLGITGVDGPLWVEHRNFTTRHLRQAGYGRMPMEIQIQNELNELLSMIREFSGKPVWPGSFLAPSVINVLWALTAGKRIPRNDQRLQKLLDFLAKRTTIFDACGGVLSQFPWLRFIIPERSGYNLIKRFNKELHEFFMETINEHKEDYKEEKAGDDLIYAYIKEMKEREGLPENTFTDTQLTMTILDIFIAGSQTTSTTLDLSFMMMVVRPDIQEKVVQEIDSHFQNGNHVSIEDKGGLPYTVAVLMEVQRLLYVIPLGGPRRVLKDATLGGYVIPKNSTVLPNLRSVHMDKNHWKDPETFRPERFLDSSGQVVFNEYLMPFGQGKRRCLGDSLARACLFTFFVGILQKFKIKLPKNEEIPSTVLQPGITLSPNPYKVEFISRQSKSNYNS